MEVLELPNKSERVIAFAWEPKGHRFAVVHGDGPRPSVSFYTMRDEKVGALGWWCCVAVVWLTTRGMGGEPQCSLPLLVHLRSKCV